LFICTYLFRYDPNYSMYLMFGIICYLIVICESFCAKTYKFLINLDESNNVMPIINKFRTLYPIVLFKIQNYHYEYRRDKNGSHRHRVNTHRAEAPFRYMEWIDQSPDATAIDYIKLQKITRLDFKLICHYTPISS